MALLVAIDATAQDTNLFDPLDQAKPEEPEPFGWLNTLTASANFSQNTFNNWQAGGTNSAAWAWGLVGRFVDNRPAFSWENNLGLEYGLIKQEGQDARKSVDLLGFETVYLRNIDYAVQPFASASLRTQLATGRDYNPAPSIETLGREEYPKTSAFADPLYLTQAVGVGRRFDPFLKSRLGFAMQETLTRDFHRYACKEEERNALLAEFGAGNLDPPLGDDAGQDPRALEFLDERCDGSKVEPGLESVTTYDRAFNDNTVFNSRLRLFYSFDQTDQLDTHWRNDLTTKVFKFLAFNFGVELLLDKDISGDLQFKQVLGLGIAYSLL